MYKFAADFENEVVCSRRTLNNKLKILVFILVVIATSFSAFSQNTNSSKKSAIDSDVVYSAEDSIVVMEDGTAFLYGKASVSYQNINLGLKLSLAIMLHNIPEGISIAIPIYYATNNKKKALNCTMFSAIAEPLGAILAFLILKNYISNNLINIILLFVASLMITLSIEGILPKIKEYNESKYIILGILSGVIVLTINLLLW